MEGTTATQTKLLISGKIMRNSQNKLEWMKKRKTKCRKDKYGHIEVEVVSRDENLFDAL